MTAWVTEGMVPRPPQQRSRYLSVPLGARIAIQYLTPLVTEPPGSGRSFQAPFAIVLIEPWASRAPGLLELSA